MGGNGEADENGAEVKLELAPVRREMPKVVYSTTLTAVSTANTRLEQRFDAA